MLMRVFVSLLIIYLIASLSWIVRSGRIEHRQEILHVACDPTRELWVDINAAFVEHYRNQTGETWEITMSHGGSASQARAVVDGLAADFVSLALFCDTDVLRRDGLISDQWQTKLANNSLPYYSTIVMVVRKGNPHSIQDWPDLVSKDISIVVPNPKTSGNGKWAVLAAWAALQRKGNTEAEIHGYMKELFRRVRVMDTSARNANATFATKKRGDVHLTWENEAILEVTESHGELELVYPPRSILAEPHVAIVEKNATEHGRLAVLQSYAEFLYSETAQSLMAKHHFRPSNEALKEAYQNKFPKLELISVQAISPSWEEVHQRFFAEGAAFDRWLRE